MGQESVENEDEKNDCNCKKGAVPSFVDVSIAIQNDKTLNLCCRQETTDGTTTLPAYRAKPADEIG